MFGQWSFCHFIHLNNTWSLELTLCSWAIPWDKRYSLSTFTRFLGEIFSARNIRSVEQCAILRTSSKSLLPCPPWWASLKLPRQHCVITSSVSPKSVPCSGKESIPNYICLSLPQSWRPSVQTRAPSSSWSSKGSARHGKATFLSFQRAVNFAFPSQVGLIFFFFLMDLHYYLLCDFLRLEGQFGFNVVSLHVKSRMTACTYMISEFPASLEDFLFLIKMNNLFGFKKQLNLWSWYIYRYKLIKTCEYSLLPFSSLRAF